MRKECWRSRNGEPFLAWAKVVRVRRTGNDVPVKVMKPAREGLGVWGSVPRSSGMGESWGSA